MPAAKRAPTNVAAVKRDLAALPDDLAQGALAAAALTLAREMDKPKNPASSKAACAGRLLDTMRELRALAPPAEKKDNLDDITARRALRLAASRGAGT
jgi:hypothetical protein